MINCKYPVDGKLPDGTRVRQDVDLVFQTPVMSTTFGMSKKEHDGKIKGTIDLSFYDTGDSDVQAFHQVMLLWDRLLLKKAKKNKKTWFNSNKVTDDILNYLFNPMVRKNIRKTDGKEFSDSFRAKVKRRFERFEAEAYNASEEPISLDEITRQSQVRLLVRQTGIWFSETMFVSSFETFQIQKMADGEITGYAFIDDSKPEEPKTFGFGSVTCGDDANAMMEDDHNGDSV